MLLASAGSLFVCPDQISCVFGPAECAALTSSAVIRKFAERSSTASRVPTAKVSVPVGQQVGSVGVDWAKDREVPGAYRRVRCRHPIAARENHTLEKLGLLRSIVGEPSSLAQQSNLRSRGEA